MSIRGEKEGLWGGYLKGDPLRFSRHTVVARFSCFRRSETVCVCLFCLFVMWVKSVGFLLLFFIFSASLEPMIGCL
jgi:hypothetical protein